MESVNRAVLSEVFGALGQDVIGNQNARDIGIQLSGIFKTKSARPFINYSPGVFNGNGINKFDNNKDKAIAGKLIVLPLNGLLVGGLYYNGSSRWGGNDSIDQNRYRLGFELECKFKMITLRSEYMEVKAAYCGVKNLLKITGARAISESYL